MSETCCDHHADVLPHGCNQGRACPERTRRIQDRELLWQCAGSGQCDSRQIASHIRAGELDAIGVEAADAPRVTGTPIVTDELRSVREPMSTEAKVIITAVILTWLAVGLLSIP